MPTNDKRAEYLAEIDLIREGAIRLVHTDPTQPSTIPYNLYQEALRIAHDVWDGVVMTTVEVEEEEEDGEDWKNN